MSEFGWTPQEIKAALDEFPEECRRIAIVFEETGSYHYRKRKEVERSTPSSPSGSSGQTTVETVELVLGDEDEDIEL